MSLVINTNVPTLNAQRALVRNGHDLARSLERLSSGLRINSARDDAAGLAITTRITSQIRGMSQAMRNANDGVSMLQTADASLSTLTENLQRIRELAVQAANGTNSDSDRKALQVEAAERLAEVERISRAASFNGTKIFSQDRTSIGGTEDERAVVDGLKMGWLQQAEKLVKDFYGIEGDGAAMQIDITSFTDGPSGVMAFVSSSLGGPGGRGTNLTLSLDMANFTPPNLPDGGTAPLYNDRTIAHEMTHAIMARATNWTSLVSTSQWFVEGAAEFIHGGDERAAIDIAAAAGATFDAKVQNLLDDLGTWGGTSADYTSGYIATRFLHEKMKDAGFDGMKEFMTFLNGPGAPTMDQALTHFFGAGYDQADFITEVQTDGVAFVNAHLNLSNTDTGAIGGLDADGGAIRTAQTVMEDVGTSYGEDVLAGFTESWEDIGGGKGAVRTAGMQIGGEVGQRIDVDFGAMNIDALGIAGVDLSQAYGAQRALIHLDAALDHVNAQRADIGAQLSRMESVIASLQVSVESGSASRSRIMETDYAAETAALTRAQILQQASTAIVAQANTQPQNVLSLLRG